MVVEDAARHVEQLADGRVSKRVPDRQAFLMRRHDVPGPKYRELLRHDRLAQLQRLSQFLNSAIAANEDFENLDADWVGERPEELGFEGSKLILHYECISIYEYLQSSKSRRVWVVSQFQMRHYPCVNAIHFSVQNATS